MKKIIKLFVCSILLVLCSIGITSSDKKVKSVESGDELIDSIVGLALEDAEFKIDNYVDINYFVNLKESTSMMVDNIQLLSTKVEEEVVSDDDIDEIQYETLTTSITNIFDDLSDEEYDVFKTLAEDDSDIAEMIKMIESNFETTNSTNVSNSSAIKTTNIVTLSTEVLEIGAILSMQNVCSAAIVAVKGAFNSMIATLKAFFVPNSVKAIIITASILVISTVVITNWNKIKPVFNQIVDIFVNNAKKLASTVTKVFDSIYKSTAKSKSKEVQEKIDDILKDSEPGRETNGPSDQYLKKGGFDQANKDYDKLAPNDSKEFNTAAGPGRRGTLDDESKVNVRPDSSYGTPTLEIQLPNGRKIKIRYGN